MEKPSDVQQLLILIVGMCVIFGAIAVYFEFLSEPVTDWAYLPVESVTFDSAHPNVLVVNATFVSEPFKPNLVLTKVYLQAVSDTNITRVVEGKAEISHVVAQGEVLEPNVLPAGATKTFTCRFDEALPSGTYFLFLNSEQGLLSIGRRLSIP